MLDAGADPGFVGLIQILVFFVRKNSKLSVHRYGDLERTVQGAVTLRFH